MLTRILLAPDAPAGAAAVAPKPAPAAPAPAPSPTLQPAAKPAPAPSGDDHDPFSDLDAKATAKKPEPKPADKKPDDTLPPDTGKTGVEGGDKDKPDAGNKEGRNFTPKALREAHDRVKGELDTVKKTLADKEKRLAEIEAKGGDTTALTAQIARIEKERDELRAEIRNVKFEVSPEFKAKYQEPFDRAADYAAQQVAQMEVTDPETGTVRPAVWEKDFAAIYQMPIGKAHKMAQELFGDSAAFVMQQYDRLHQLDYEKSKAMEGEKANAQTREQENTTKRQQQMEAAKATWTAVDRNVKENNPLFQDDPADPEGNALLEGGYKLVDQAYGTDNRSKLTVKQLATLDANIRHRAASFTRLVSKNSRLTEENAALKAEVENFRKGGPGPGSRTGAEGGGGKKEESIKSDPIWDELKSATPD